MELEASRVHLIRKRRGILNGISLKFQSGCRYALVGPNGAGKSTLLRCLAGILTPQSGTINLDHRPLKSWHARDLKQQIAYLPQSTIPTFAYTVREFIGLGGATTEAISEVVTLLDLTRQQSANLLTLSGGERQRAAIARVLVQDSRFLLLDEPFANLDPRYQHTVMSALDRSAERDQGILVVVHDLAFARAHFQDFILLDQGHLTATGTSDIVLSSEQVAKTYGLKWDANGHLTVPFESA